MFFLLYPLFFGGCVEKKGVFPQELPRKSGGVTEKSEICKTRGEIFEIKKLLREGDIVFRRGRGLTSRAVLAADAEGIYSHVGIVVRVGGENEADVENGVGEEYAVVHIVPGEADENGVEDVIKIESPEKFFAENRASRGAVMRLRGESGCDSAVSEAAARRVAKGEARGATRGVARGAEEQATAARRAEEVAMAAAQRASELATAAIRFDHDYDLADTTKMYCTELIRNVYLSAGTDLTEGRRTRINMPGFSGDHILPTNLTDSPLLEFVYRF